MFAMVEFCIISQTLIPSDALAPDARCWLLCP